MDSKTIWKLFLTHWFSQRKNFPSKTELQFNDLKHDMLRRTCLYIDTVTRNFCLHFTTYWYVCLEKSLGWWSAGLGGGEGLSKLVDESLTFWVGSKIAMIIVSTGSIRGLYEASSMWSPSVQILMEHSSPIGCKYYLFIFPIEFQFGPHLKNIS